MKPAPLLSRRSLILILLAAFTVIGLLLTFYRFLEDESMGHTGMFVPRFIDEMTGAYAALVSIPIAIFAARRFPISKATWLTAVPVAILAAIVYSAIHTTLMWGTRSLLYPLAGLGSYDYGIMAYRYPMEASNDIVSFAFVLGFVYAWYNLAAAREAELAAAELRTELAQAQLENLRLQLNPHFLFNTLNAISAVMYEDVRKADAMLAKLSDFLRIVLDSHGAHQVPIDEELAVERKYVEIMTTRLEQRLALQVDVDDAAANAVVPFMILQPLLENCIRHGVSPDRGAIDIAIAVARHNGSTVISIADDGVGFAPKDGVASGRGIGLVRSRLQHMYGDSGRLEIGRGAGGGTTAVVTLPFVQMESA